MAGSTFEKDLNNAYEKIVLWKKNLFILQSGAAGKRYVEEVTRVMDTRYTIEVNITENSSCYAGVTFLKTKLILKSQRSSSSSGETHKIMELR